MSADNWAKCPRCADTDTAEIKELENDLRDSYGKVSLEEYENLQTQIEEAKYQIKQNSAKATFREDYEIYGAETGILTISYRGVCNMCGLSNKINEERYFYPVQKNSPERTGGI